jgi:hypothetical protein
MGRIQVAFPFVFASESGNHPASELDESFQAIPDTGFLTIRTQELSDGADYNVETDDEFSYFVCKGVDDFQIIPQLAPAAGFSFFFSNETQQEAAQIDVTLCCTVFVGTVQYVNPILVGDFPPNFFNVKGGLVQYDGNQWNFYPLFYATSGGGAVRKGTVAVLAGATTVVVTHGLNQPSLVTQVLPKWNTSIWQTAVTDTTASFEFSNPAPANLTLDYLVFLS